jgi:hypothetical protein
MQRPTSTLSTKSDCCVGSAAADRRDHVDPRAGRERRVKCGSLAFDVDVDVAPQVAAVFAEAVAETRPALVELRNGVRDRSGVELEPAREAGEERWKRGRQVELGHVYSMRATSTDEMPGR